MQNLTSFRKDGITQLSAKLFAVRHNTNELKTMKQRRILLPTIEDAKEFVAAASKCDFDIDIYYNRIIIDAKSSLGVLSLDLKRVLTVEFDGENEEFEALLEKRAAGKRTAA